MSRERSFDEAEVLERAADAFSVHGYAGTSVAILAAATGLGKQSLYMIAYSIVCNLYDVVCLFSFTSIALKISLYENGIYLLI